MKQAHVDSCRCVHGRAGKAACSCLCMSSTSDGCKSLVSSSTNNKAWGDMGGGSRGYQWSAARQLLHRYLQLAELSGRQKSPCCNKEAKAAGTPSGHIGREETRQPGRHEQCF